MADSQPLAGHSCLTPAAVSGQPSQRLFQLADYTPVFEAASALKSPAILVGGQAVHFWATRYIARFPLMEAFMPYTSQDADYLADVPAAEDLARHLKSRFYPSPFKGGMLGLTLGDIPLRDDMRVEILGHINGVKNNDVHSAAIVITWQNLQVRIIHPAQLYIGKGCNLLSSLSKNTVVEWRREGRIGVLLGSEC